MRAAIVVGVCLYASGALAQDSEASAYVEGEESAALEALRRAEMEMFGRRQALVETPGVQIGVPDAASSHVAHFDRPAEGRPAPWLEGLNLSDLPVRFHDQVVQYLEYFRDERRGRHLMSAWLRRSSRYGSMIRSTLRARELPEDLQCVAMAESGFDPTIRSRRGAVGLWQFVSRTGREYGLSSNRWRDERMDPIKSTDAAARMLGDLHRRFGSWELALAAYNMGYGALLRAIRKYNTNDYWTLAELEAGLPFETTIYVAKIMACAIVMRNGEAFGYGELTRDPPMEVEPFEVPGSVGIPQLARAAGISADELRALNPELRRNRTPPGRSYPIRIPAGQSERFARAWSRIQPRRPAHQPYLVRLGDTERSIARRYRTRVSALRELNDTREGERLGPGMTILVPAVEPREDDDDEETPVVAVPEGSFHYPDRRRVFYRVAAGDSLWTIGQFFGASVSEIAQWNHVDPAATLHRGMYLQLFVPREVDLSRAVVLGLDDVRLVTVGTEAFFDRHEEAQGRVRFRYRVVEGDTLVGIGRRFGLSVGSIARINRFSRRHDLRVGEEVIIYAEPGRVPSRFRRATGATPDAGEAEAETAADGEAAAEADGEAAEADGEAAEADGEAADEADGEATEADGEAADQADGAEEADPGRDADPATEAEAVERPSEEESEPETATDADA